MSNVNDFSGSCDFNWWGTNNISDAGIAGTLPDNYYQMELSAVNTSTRDVNKTVNGFVPVFLGYRLVLNDTNDTGNISNLPDFNAIIKLNNSTGLLRKSLDSSRFSMMPGSAVDVLAKNPWNDTIDTAGNYTFSGLVDNQELNLNINATERMNTSLSLNASNITYGDNTNISATLTGNGTVLGNKSIIFNINGTDYTNTTDEYGVAVLSIGNLSVGEYNVSAAFGGDDEYNPIKSQVIFNVNSLPTPPGPDPDNNNTNSSNDTNITPNYPINDGGLGTIGTGFLDSTGLPLLLLIILSVLGLVYYRRK